MTDSAVPRFATGMKFRFDTVRERWVVLGPERLFLPDETAVEVLKLVDGQRSLDDIADALAARFDAPRETIAVDVAAMLRDLAEKGAIRL
ncbi:MAG: pyrroloquinoline quinone biosynthesis peptide chaperone PqqD [Acetobacteraceae bacterium]|nr:pyrroloquinoline quinone biosynthesis peptide chaperone PqqD [Acetobacteraceae bacterium]